MNASDLYPVVSISAPPAPSPLPQRVPFGWAATAVAPGSDGVVLRWSGALPEGAARLRLVVALDQREAKRVELSLAQSGEALGELDSRFGYAGQCFEAELSAAQVSAVAREGLRLRLSAGALPFWFFSGQLPEGEGSRWLLPHLIPVGERPANPWHAAYGYLASVASAQPFGWLEGCVLEGLSQLEASLPEWSGAAAQATRDHLALYFTGHGLVYENPRGLPVDNRLVSMEATLMLPALFRQQPEHPGLEMGREFWRAKDADGVIGGLGYQKCEVCYTVNYPLALLSRHHGDEAGMARALQQLLHQMRVLREGDTIYQAHYQGVSTFPNWSRGLAWYLLGFARVLEITGVDFNADAREAARELERACGWITSLQRADGLWDCYAHLPETGAETSGTGGIAAALLLAHRLGCAPDDAAEAAGRAVRGLERYLSPDGMLHGVCQSNKPEAGDALQREGFRCYSQMGLGLAVQAAALWQARERQAVS